MTKCLTEWKNKVMKCPMGLGGLEQSSYAHTLSTNRFLTYKVIVGCKNAQVKEPLKLTKSLTTIVNEVKNKVGLN